MKHINTGRTFFLSFLFVLLSLGFVQAQTPSFFFDAQSVNTAATVNFDLKVTSFQDILGMQFSINWNPEVLEYVTVENFGLLGIALLNNFGTTMVADGKMGFLWTDSAAAGVSLDDDTVIFSIRFKVIGADQSTTELGFGSMPTTIEISNNDGVVTSNLLSGLISVMGTDGVYNTAPDKIEVKECFPNPFTEKTQIDFNLINKTELSLSVIDQTGRLVYKQPAIYAAGQNQITLTKDLFPSSGIYYYELISSEFRVSQKIIFVD